MSRQIVHQQKWALFSKLFKLLDSDSDDFISCDLISLDQLPLEVIQRLKPIFEELDSLQGEGIN